MNDPIGSNKSYIRKFISEVALISGNSIPQHPPFFHLNNNSNNNNTININYNLGLIRGLEHFKEVFILNHLFM